MAYDKSSREALHELSYYTLAHPDTVYFIHQHIVDAYQAQTADDATKPIGLIFSLVGLHLYLDKGFTGRQVQQAHMKMAQNKKAWPPIQLPQDRGAITVSNVLQETPGPQRDEMIRQWCVSVWTAYKQSHPTIAALVSTELAVR